MVGTPGDEAFGAISPDVQATLFRDDIEVGETGVISVPAGALVYEVTRHDPFDAGEFAERRDDLLQEVLAGKRVRYVQDVIERLRLRQNIEINRPIVQAFDGQS